MRSLRLFYMLIIFCAFCQTASDAPAEEVSRYRVRVRGISARRLGIAFEHVLNTEALRDQPPPDAAMLERRAQADIPRLHRALEARGYYGARVSAHVDMDRRTPRVVFEVQRGERYRLGTVDFAVVDPPLDSSPPPEPPPDLVERFERGMAVDAQTLLDAERTLMSFYRNHGYPWAQWETRKYILDHEARRLHAGLRIRPGAHAEFGPTVIEGHEDVEERHIRRLLPWQTGAQFDARQLERAQRNLLLSGLFSVATINYDEPPGSSDRLPLTVTVQERPHRTAGVAVRYRTDEGVGGSVLWRHRNLAGAGEQIALMVDVFEDRTEYEVEARKPAFLRHDQQLIGSASITDERTDAFASRATLVNLRVVRDVRHDLFVSAGGRLKTAITRQAGIRRRTTLIGAPMSVIYDTREDLLDPEPGINLDIKATPMLGLPEADLFFVKIQPLIGGVWQAVPGVKLAFQTRWSAILGAGHASIPADERYYGGGGGSVRGYAYQSLSPLRDGEAEGGRFMIENAFEIRWRLTERIGVSGFIDSGQATRDSLPDLNDLAWAGGVGLRYHLPQVGPLRLDVAAPIDRRPKDDSYQIYISLGQAF